MDLASFITIVFFVAITPFVVVGRGFQYAGILLKESVIGIASGIGIGKTADPAPVPQPPDKNDGPIQPAYKHYLFEQAWLDTRQASKLALRRHKTAIKSNWTRIVEKYFRTGRDLDSKVIIGAGSIGGLGLGIALAEILLAVITLLQAIVLAVLWGVGMALVYVLRVTDSTLLLIRGVRITCPNCYHRVSYPSYHCPGCRTVHGDVRPGRYGVLTRRCRCTKAFPTLLMLGSYKMEGVCPRCNTDLEGNAGRSAEIVLPVFGASGAGKTQLMVVLTVMIRELVERNGGQIIGADNHTKDWLADAPAQLSRSGRTDKTGPTAQRPYSFELKLSKRKSRMVKLFDAAGEFFLQAEKIESLRYLLAAQTFIFVVDPLSIRKLWASLGPDEQASVKAIRADREPFPVFEQTVQNITGMGVVTRKARLIVAVTKSDLVEDRLKTDGTYDDASIREWFSDKLGEDNMVRAMDHSFKEVHFMLTSALYDGSVVDSSIEPVARSVLAGQKLGM